MNTINQPAHIAKNIGLLVKGKDLLRYLVGGKGMSP